MAQVAVIHENEAGQEVNRQELRISEQMSAGDLSDAVADLVRRWVVGVGDVVRIVEL